MMIDPPSGWRYGFPARYNKEEHGDMGEFLAQRGYPRDEIDFALQHMRCWNEEDKNSS